MYSLCFYFSFTLKFFIINENSQIFKTLYITFIIKNISKKRYTIKFRAAKFFILTQMLSNVILYNM